MKMEKTYISDPLYRKTGWFMYFAAAFFFFTGWVLLLDYIYFVLFDTIHREAWAFLPYDLIIIGILFFFLAGMGWCIHMRYGAVYEFSDEGVWAKYPFRKRYLNQWDEFQEVCAAYHEFDVRKGMGKGLSVIYCIRKGQKKNVYGRWKINPYLYKKVITVAYSPELFEGVKDKCPFAVTDERDKGCYRQY